MFHPTRVAVLFSVLIAAVFFVSACGATAATPAINSAEAANGEAPAVTYVDARYHYKVDGPGRMTASADGTASVIGPSERLEISIIQGTRAANPLALARDDASTLPASATNFRMMAAPTEITLNHKKVEKFVYSYSAGTSAVTGKPVDLVVVRYYISKDASTVAVLKYGIVANQYDPQGADDIASTFQWQ
jgi:hypothetical protein